MKLKPKILEFFTQNKSLISYCRIERGVHQHCNQSVLVTVCLESCDSHWDYKAYSVLQSNIVTSHLYCWVEISICIGAL
jgi:hypothetical protein